MFTYQIPHMDYKYVNVWAISVYFREWPGAITLKTRKTTADKDSHVAEALGKRLQDREFEF